MWARDAEDGGSRDSGRNGPGCMGPGPKPVQRQLSGRRLHWAGAEAWKEAAGGGLPAFSNVRQ